MAPPKGCDSRRPRPSVELSGSPAPLSTPLITSLHQKEKQLSGTLKLRMRGL
ncbi:uncharacterized protein NEPG_02142 [Nematocida parisii ERTm1]|uniref:Uncharacterized protein n=1 Tax=Nematocida parisii (strain ERTm3) TaxID=935791 RepID=I3EFH1_NEMP3|nr:uncharacterized protein NEPG_02142 [Nematocida parisii ERTm1]EIJ87968.1 hypothetical protein NEQG_02040 [Nematocida parisii ERTm3]EIJ93186.1 hypothetical protein NEPG_02142 [Nematocida parisii ERTm1]|eukprot:XP_013059969.1 hypothetical protein NEPG_02142 [Nematocida parisii ERTm1]